jgi:hypothetical protein
MASRSSADLEALRGEQRSREERSAAELREAKVALEKLTKVGGALDRGARQVQGPPFTVAV